MGHTLLLFWLLSWLLGGKGGGATERQPDGTRSPPWPDATRGAAKPDALAVTPEHMVAPSKDASQPPPWSASTWEFDSPPSQEEVQRAWVLLPGLWASGEGSTQQEQLASGKWVTYRAEFHDSEHKIKGVTVYRLRGAPRA